MVFNLDQYLSKYADTFVPNETTISGNKLRLLFVVDVIYCLNTICLLDHFPLLFSLSYRNDHVKLFLGRCLVW